MIAASGTSSCLGPPVHLPRGGEALGRSGVAYLQPAEEELQEHGPRLKTNRHPGNADDARKNLGVADRVVRGEGDVTGWLQVVDACKHDHDVRREIDVADLQGNEAFETRPTREPGVRDVRAWGEERSQAGGPGRRVVGREEIEGRRSAFADDPGNAGLLREGKVADVRRALAPGVEVDDLSRGLERRVRPPRDDEVRVRAIGPSDLLDELRVRLNPRLGPGPGLRAQRNAAPALKGEEEQDDNPERREDVRGERAEGLHASHRDRTKTSCNDATGNSWATSPVTPRGKNAAREKPEKSPRANSSVWKVVYPFAPSEAPTTSA